LGLEVFRVLFSTPFNTNDSFSHNIHNYGGRPSQISAKFASLSAQESNDIAFSTSTVLRSYDAAGAALTLGYVQREEWEQLMEKLGIQLYASPLSHFPSQFHRSFVLLCLSRSETALLDPKLISFFNYRVNWKDTMSQLGWLMVEPVIGWGDEIRFDPYRSASCVLGNAEKQTRLPLARSGSPHQAEKPGLR
jgi:hypothetical protein